MQSLYTQRHTHTHTHKHTYIETQVRNTHLFKTVVPRAGHFGFAVLLCSYKKATSRSGLAIKVTHFWTRPIKITYPAIPNQIHSTKKCKT